LKKAIFIIIPLLIVIVSSAITLAEVTIPGDVSGPTWYVFNAGNPTVISITPYNLTPTVNASDNLRIGLITQVKQAGGSYEILTIRLKINGILTVGSPRYGIIDQELTQWSNEVPIYVIIDGDKIEVEINKTIIWSYTANEEIPQINYVYADSAEYGKPAFTNQGYVYVKVDNNKLMSIQLGKSTKAAFDLFLNIMPLVFGLIALGMIMGFFGRIARRIG